MENLNRVLENVLPAHVAEHPGPGAWKNEVREAGWWGEAGPWRGEAGPWRERRGLPGEAGLKRCKIRVFLGNVH